MAEESQETRVQEREPPKPPEPPAPLKIVDGDYTLSVEYQGPRRPGDKRDTRPSFALRITHKQRGEVFLEPHCGDSQAFCVNKGGKLINAYREEEKAPIQSEDQ